ncbi:MAG: GNAT family N-acetyltransferase [Nocardioidaceae bacterium]
MTEPLDTFVIRERTLDHPDAVMLIEQVQAYYVRIYGGPDTSPLDADEFRRPGGAFFIGYLDDQPITMGGWRFHPAPPDIGAARVAEIKRMYVVEGQRGKRLARTMLAHLESSACVAGANALVLETGRVQPEAIALYRSSGYVDVPRFGHYAAEPAAVHLGKLISPST